MRYRWLRMAPVLLVLMMVSGCGAPAGEAPSVRAPEVQAPSPAAEAPAAPHEPSATTPPATELPPVGGLAEAEAALSHGKKMQAMVLLQDALKAHPDRYEPHLLLARAYLAAGWWDDAKQEAREVLRLQPGQPDAQNVLADKPPADWQVTAPVDPREGAFWRGTVDGHNVYLHANDQVTWVEEASWAGAVQGMTGHGGTFAWYVEPTSGAAPVRQPLLLWSDWASDNAGPRLTFGGGMRPVSTFQFGGHDLLVIWQAMNSNQKEAQLFGWSDAEGHLVQYSFRFSGDQDARQWIHVSGDPEPNGTALQTRFYDPMYGLTVHTWELQGSTFVEVKREKQQ